MRRLKALIKTYRQIGSLEKRAIKLILLTILMVTYGDIGEVESMSLLGIIISLMYFYNLGIIMWLMVKEDITEFMKKVEDNMED